MNNKTDQAKKQCVLIGEVVSDKMDKTATVVVQRRLKHPVYGKYITRSSRIKIHDSENQCVVGNRVSITLGVRQSKTKSWQLVKILEKSEAI